MSHVFRFIGIPSNPDRLDEPWDLPEAEGHHALKVLRLAPGTIVECTDGQGQAVVGSIEVAGRHAARIQVQQLLPPALPNPRADTIIMGCLENDEMDLVLATCTELGIPKVLVYGQPHTPRWQLGDKAQARIRSVLDSSMKQCKRARRPEVTLVASLDVALATCAQEQPTWFGACLPSGPIDLLTALAGVAKSQRIALVIGGRSGLGDAELAMIESVQATHCNLGCRATLRARTAVLGAAFALTGNAAHASPLGKPLDRG